MFLLTEESAGALSFLYTFLTD